MKSAQYYVFTCMDCNDPILIKVEFMEFKNMSCLDFKNHKLLKVFNNESEAKNFYDVIKRNEEK